MKTDPVIKTLRTMCNKMKEAHVTLDDKTLTAYMNEFALDIMVIMDYWEIFDRLTISIPKALRN